MNRRDFVLGAGLGLATAMVPAATAAEATPPAAGARGNSRFSVRDFGATGDGKTSDTAAIQKALAAGEILEAIDCRRRTVV